MEAAHRRREGAAPARAPRPAPKRVPRDRPRPGRKFARRSRPKTASRPARKSSARAATAAPARKSPARSATAVPARRPRARPAVPRRRGRTGSHLIPIAVGTATAVRQFPDSTLIVRMTQGRLWIGVLGTLLAGIVALNVFTLSLTAEAGHIDQNIVALETGELDPAQPRRAALGLMPASVTTPARSGSRWPPSTRSPRSSRAVATSPSPSTASPLRERATNRPMRTIDRRIGLLFAGFLLCFLMIVGRAFWLQGVQGAQLASEASYQQTEVVTVPGLRGTVLDRHGEALAASEDAATIYATPYQVKNPPAGSREAGDDPRRGPGRRARRA